MGTSVRSSPSIVVRELQVKPPKSQWLSLVLRRRSCATPLTTTASSPSSLSWRRCALLRSKRFTLSLSSEYKKSPIFHHNVWSKLDELAEHLAKTELIPV